MRLLFLAVFLIVNLLGAKHCNAQGTGTFQWTNGAPNNNPGLSGAKFAVDKNSYRWYEWTNGTNWVQCGDRIQQISGCAAPAYTPTIHNAYFVVNGCTNPEFYYWNGAAWKLLNSGATYMAGSGIAISGGNVISADTSILATQYDISQLGVTWPLLAPNGTPTEPTYSFAENPTGGLMFEDGAVKILAGGDEGDLITRIEIKGSKSIADAGGDVLVSSGDGVTSAGNLVFSGGLGVNTGGGFQMTGGISTQGNGGGFNMTGGSANEGNGGTFILRGGYSDSGNAGNINAFGGESANGNGGNVFFSGGGSEGGNGGSISFSGGNTDSETAQSGSISFSTSASSSGLGGDIAFTTAGNGLTKPVVFDSAGIQYKALTTTQRDALTGLTGGRVIWNSTLSKLQVYNGSTWENLH